MLDNIYTFQEDASLFTPNCTVQWTTDYILQSIHLIYKHCNYTEIITILNSEQTYTHTMKLEEPLNPLTPSHPHTLTPSYPHTSHPHTLTPSYKCLLSLKWCYQSIMWTIKRSDKKCERNVKDEMWREMWRLQWCIQMVKHTCIYI